MDTKVVIMMMVLAGLQILRELIGLYRDTRDIEDTDDRDFESTQDRS